MSSKTLPVVLVTWRRLVPSMGTQSGAPGKVDFTIWTSWKATERTSLSTTVTAAISTTPKVGSFDPSGRTDTAAWAAIR